MRDKDFERRMAEMFALAIADALGIDLKKITMEVLEEKLKECERNEEYEKCAVIRDKIKEIK
jgi:protein-arginine kinase activator protein McsA